MLLLLPMKAITINIEHQVFFMSQFVLKNLQSYQKTWMSSIIKQNLKKLIINDKKNKCIFCL